MRKVRFFISVPSYHVLLRRSQYKEAQFFLKFSEVLTPARYHACWSRRMRETTKLSREDTAMIALATFGTDQSGTTLGAHRLVTYDQPMINGYMAKRQSLQRRLQAMEAQLLQPYDQATLPQLMSADDVLKEWAD